MTFSLPRALILLALTVPTFAQVDPVQAALDKKDYATAVKLLRPIADGGDAQAQSLLGELYANGEGVKKNFAEAMTLWRKAANQNTASASSMPMVTA
jgi:TPR repeat protein